MPNRQPHRASRAKVLLLTADPVVAALLGLIAESADYVPAFAAEGERAEDAVERVRPVFVVLVDGALEAADSDLFYARAAKRRVGLAVFRPEGRDDFPSGARRRGVPCVTVPMGVGALEAVLEQAAASRWWERTDRRRAPHAVHGADGSLLLVDGAGSQWRVYDRRGSDRRHAPAGDAAGVERHFVGEGGETRVYVMHTGDSEANLAVDLARQLDRAMPAER